MTPTPCSTWYGAMLLCDARRWRNDNRWSRMDNSLELGSAPVAPAAAPAPLAPGAGAVGAATRRGSHAARYFGTSWAGARYWYSTVMVSTQTHTQIGTQIDTQTGTQTHTNPHKPTQPHTQSHGRSLTPGMVSKARPVGPSTMAEYVRAREAPPPPPPPNDLVAVATTRITVASRANARHQSWRWPLPAPYDDTPAHLRTFEACDVV